MALRASDIATELKKQIESFEPSTKAVDVGSIMEVGDGIARISGLAGVMANELLEFPGGVYGIALNLEDDNVGAVILGEYTALEEGDNRARHGPHRLRAGGAGASGAGGECPGAAYRWQGADRLRQVFAGGAHCPQRYRSPTCGYSCANGCQGYRRHGSHRARTA